MPANPPPPVLTEAQYWMLKEASISEMVIWNSRGEWTGPSPHPVKRGAGPGVILHALEKLGLLQKGRGSTFTITPRGRAVLEDPHLRLR
jgi:hypothetical protein